MLLQYQTHNSQTHFTISFLPEKFKIWAYLAASPFKVKVLGMAAEEAALAGAPEALAALKAVNSRTRGAMLVVAVAEYVVVTVGKLWFELCMEVLHRCNRAVEKVVDGGAMAAVQARC